MDQMFTEIANIADGILKDKPEKEEPHDQIDQYIANKITKLQEELKKGGIFAMLGIEPTPLTTQNQEVM